MNKPVCAVLAVAVLAALTACSNGSAAANVLTCDTIVDPGGSQTAGDVITDMDAMMLTDQAANVRVGAGPDDATVLQAAAGALTGYTGSQLAADAAQFAADEQSYDPGSNPDNTYAAVVAEDVTDLANDCNTQEAAEQLAGLQP